MFWPKTNQIVDTRALSFKNRGFATDDPDPQIWLILSFGIIQTRLARTGRRQGFLTSKFKIKGHLDRRAAKLVFVFEMLLKCLPKPIVQNNT